MGLALYLSRVRSSEVLGACRSRDYCPDRDHRYARLPADSCPHPSREVPSESVSVTRPEDPDGIAIYAFVKGAGCRLEFRVIKRIRHGLKRGCRNEMPFIWIRNRTTSVDETAIAIGTRILRHAERLTVELSGAHAGVWAWHFI